MRKEIIGDCTLYLADSIDVLPLIERVDAVIADPPYGVFLGEMKGGPYQKQNGYDGFQDTPGYVKNVCVPIIKKCIEISERCLVTPGNRNMFLYPVPDDIGVWWNPAGTSRGKWGFNCASPIFYYGKEKRSGVGNTPSSFTAGHDRGEKPDHPCPKPLGFVKKLIHKGSIQGETIYDPFTGSGTTGVACIELDRKFIGSEINEKDFDVACNRIEQAVRQGKLFNHAQLNQQQIHLEL